jgi:hypothetical protein
MCPSFKFKFVTLELGQSLMRKQYNQSCLRNSGSKGLLGPWLPHSPEKGQLVLSVRDLKHQLSASISSSKEAVSKLLNVQTIQKF